MNDLTASDFKILMALLQKEKLIGNYHTATEEQIDKLYNKLFEEAVDRSRVKK